MMSIKILIALFCVFMLNSCQNNDTLENVVESEKMISLLVDIHKTDALLSERSRKLKAQTENIYETVLKKHNITREKFDASIDYYSKHSEEFEEMYVEIMRELNNLNNSEEDTLKTDK